MKYRLLPFSWIIYFILILGLTSCHRSYIPVNGDLVFQDLDCGDLCQAIEKVTQGYEGANFSHCGIISIEHDSAFVLEAIGPGVIRTPFSEFLKRSQIGSGKTKVMVGRLKPEFRETIPAALRICKNLLGKPYDDAFDLHNDRYYCSELLYYSLMDKDHHPLFEPHPMTFKDPETGKTFPAWTDYFKDLNVPIPEGAAGLNPGGISRSSKMDMIYRFY